MFSFDQLKYPLIQAPMAGGPNTPEMVSTVANLGAVGSYGFAYSSAGKIRSDLLAARAMTADDCVGAMNANFFIFNEVSKPEPANIEAAIKNLREVSDYQVDFEAPAAPFFPDLSKQLEPVWEIRPEILTFHFGIPDLAIIRKAHALGIAIGITATSNDEARQIEQAGADFIVAQGIEAGGHRGIFNPANRDDKLPCFELIKSLSAINLPLVAAGGIMKANQIREALALGATAVQMGTVFLTTVESGASKAHKGYLLNNTERPSEITWGFSGRPARGIKNRFIKKILGKTILPFPLQNSLTAKMRAAALAEDDGEFQSLWAGSNFADCRQETITELLERLFS
jgi:nitronate monooxygenase